MGLGAAGGAGLGLDEALGDRANPELVRNLYEQLIYECTGISKDALHGVRHCSTADGEPLPRYPELHEESLPVLHFMRALYVWQRADMFAPHTLRNLRTATPPSSTHHIPLR